MEEKYMKIALEQAKKALSLGEVPIGAVIIKNNKVISKAYNKKENNLCAVSHAEIIAIEKATRKLKNWRLDGCEIYVTLEPCPMCASAIQQSRISTVIYGASNSCVEESIIVEKIFELKNANKKVETVQNILKDECCHILKNFFSQKR